MPGFNNYGKALMLNEVRNVATHISLHSGDTGDAGLNEISGGGYARWAVTTADFTAVSEGAFLTNADHTFDAEPAQSAPYIGLWDNSNFIGGGAVTGDTEANAEGEIVLKAGTSINLNAA